jgi:hypothetical protein
MMMATVILASVVVRHNAASIGTAVCFIGYVMDTYCINRGTLLDNPSVKTLEHPEEHTVHCLVDVQQCTASGYQLLLDPPAGSTTYCAAYTLDAAGNAMIIEDARRKGVCSTCSGAGVLRKGYRAAVRGIVTGSGASPLLAVTSVGDAEGGCADGVTIPDATQCSIATGANWFVVHGSLMMISWGALLPVGVVSARLLKYLGGTTWFLVHRAVQPLGLTVALVGWVIALVNFDVFSASRTSAEFVHG